jgi:hypothetical protein
LEVVDQFRGVEEAGVVLEEGDDAVVDDVKGKDVEVAYVDEEGVGFGGFTHDWVAQRAE